MTESEARSKIKYRIEVAREIVGNGVDGKAFEDLEIAIQALKEIREYRELGTVEELQELKEKNELKKPKMVVRFGRTTHECPNCSQLLYDDQNFCHDCGIELDWKGGGNNAESN